MIVSWWQVKAATIKRCFEKPGFARNAAASDTDWSDDAVDETIDVNDVWSNFVERHLVDAINMFGSYGKCVGQLQKATTDETITTVVRCAAGSAADESDDEDDTPEVSCKDAIKSLAELK